jgi:nucleoside-diphosphate-sugar epimerase
MASGRILITGGSGFIGCNLVDYYDSRGWEVVNLSDVPPRNLAQARLYRECDIEDRDTLYRLVKEIRPEVVVHLAARTDLDGKTVADYSTNVQGCQNVVDAVNAVGTVRRALYASSRLVFKIDHKPKHDYDYKPSTPYGESKIETERIVKAQPDGSVPWMLFRPTSIWGEWFDVPYKTFFLQVAKNRYIHPKGMKIEKSFGYVGNSCYQIDRYLNASDEDFNGKAYFVSDYPPIEVYNWGSMIASAMGVKPIRQVPLAALKAIAAAGDLAGVAGMKNPPLTTFRLNNLMTQMVYDLSREERICGPLPFGLPEAIERTVKWMRDHRQI